jgi:lysophospholipase L1-like esterase
MGASEVQGNKAVSFVAPAYPDILRDALPTVDMVVDCGVSRITTTVCDRIDALLHTHRPAVVLVAVGGNDADCDWRRLVMSDGKIAHNRVKLETYESNLRKIVGQIASSGARAILTEPSNQCLAMRGPYLSRLSNRDVTAMIDAHGGQAECDRRLTGYRQAVARVAIDTGSELVSCAVDIADHDPQEILCEDGVHLSAIAHRHLATSYAASLSKMFAPLPSVA